MTEFSDGSVSPMGRGLHGNLDLFYPSEHAALCDWFGLARPGICEDLDLFARPKWAPGIWPVLSEGEDRELARKNAIARIALGSIQRDLPRFLYRDPSTGRLLPARRFYPVPMRPVALEPEFLFQINWADSAPGLSWPESYHLTLLPGYDRWVVTLSCDSTDTYGYTDLAIGWFGVGEGKRDGVRAVICDWWRAQGDGTEGTRWDCVLQEGLVSGEEADAWADEVWNPQEECPDCGETYSIHEDHECEEMLERLDREEEHP